MSNDSKTIWGLGLLVLGLALCGAGLWLLLKPDVYCATARIKVEDADANNPASFDPYFIQTTFEIIRSDLVISNVVVGLNLSKKWGDQFNGGEPLATPKSIFLIRQNLELKPIWNTKLVAIGYTDRNPVEAAAIANAVANSYIEYEKQSQRRLMTPVIKVYQDQYEAEEKEIAAMQAGVNELRAQWNSHGGVSSNSWAEQKSYFDAKKSLDQFVAQHGLLASRLATARAQAVAPETLMVTMVDMAEPPQSPVPRLMALALSLLVAGLCSIVAGWLLLMASRREI